MYMTQNVAHVGLQHLNIKRFVFCIEKVKTSDFFAEHSLTVQLMSGSDKNGTNKFDFDHPFGKLVSFEPRYRYKATAMHNARIENVSFVVNPGGIDSERRPLNRDRFQSKNFQFRSRYRRQIDLNVSQQKSVRQRTFVSILIVVSATSFHNTRIPGYSPFRLFGFYT